MEGEEASFKLARIEVDLKKIEDTLLEIREDIRRAEVEIRCNKEDLTLAEVEIRNAVDKNEEIKLVKWKWLLEKDKELNLKLQTLLQVRATLLQERSMLRKTENDIFMRAGKASEAKVDEDALQRALMKALDAREMRPLEQQFSFSKFTESSCRKLMRSLGIRLINGDHLSPIKVPDGYDCGTFAIGTYPGEEQAHLPFLEFLAKALKDKGVPMDVEGGFELLDLRRDRGLYELSSGDFELVGGLDAAIGPWGISSVDPASQVCCSIELKYSKAPQEGKAFFAGTTFGQSCAELISAFVFTEYPKTLHVTTSFHNNFLLEMRREAERIVIVHWSAVSFDAVVFKLVEYLREGNAPLLSSLNFPEQVPDSDEIVRFRKKLRMGKGSLLQDQLESLSAICDSPNERFFLAYELVRSFRQNEKAPDISTIHEPLKSAPEGMYL